MPLNFPADDVARRMGYSVNRLDRVSDRRTDAEWLARLAERPAARCAVFIADKVVIDPAAGQVMLPMATARTLGLVAADLAFLGLVGDLPPPGDRLADRDRPAWFAGLASASPEAVEAAGLALIDLRALVLTGAVPAEEAGAVAEGRALFHWHQTHGYCARCGAASRMSQGGFRRDCPTCEAQHFPRTDPVVIMAIVDSDRILLGRQARFPPGMYSCLAGFLEPGETIEDAVRRETWEEAGIRVGRVAYHASQPWPFPNSLMIGCLGEALSRDIVPDASELEDCRWFTRAEAISMLEERHPGGVTSPKPIAIAHHLLRAFIDAG